MFSRNRMPLNFTPIPSGDPLLVIGSLNLVICLFLIYSSYSSSFSRPTTGCSASPSHRFVIAQVLKRPENPCTPRGQASAVRARGAWPRPLFNYYFSRKIKTQINHFLVEPWSKPAPAEQNCSHLFLEQFWLRSGGRLQPRVGTALFFLLIFLNSL